MSSKHYVPITLATIAISLISVPLLSQGGNAEIQVKESSTSDRVSELSQDRVTFSCSEAVDRTSGENIPATVAWIPQKGEGIPIILWQSDYFAAWEPQTRCETVSPKFQTFYEDGRMKYLTNGINQGYPVICAVISKQEQCNGENQLFQVKPHDNPQLVLRRLLGIVEGKVEGPLLESSGEQVYISIEEVLEKK